MQKGGVLCALLLLVGACGAYPQYGPAQQQQPEEQQAAQPGAASLTDEQKEALGEFWWKNQNVFGGEAPEGSVVVVQEPSAPGSQALAPEELAIPFIPSPSPDCPALHGCIPWQYCKNGQFSNNGEGLGSLGTPSTVPETYTQKLCGQIGNICCQIPDAILQAQQQGQGGGPDPYDGGIIEVVGDGGIVAIVDEIGQVPGDAGGSVTIIEEVIDGGVGVVGGGGYDGGSQGTTGEQQIPEIVEVVSTPDTGCPAYTHECVPYFQCDNGEINTSGAGLIDVRIKPKQCTNPEYPDVPAICCRVPDAFTPSTPAPTTPTTVAPLRGCPGTRVCVAQYQCNADGSVNTDGSGIINTRLNIACYLDSADASNTATGICCEPPPPPPPAHLETCPGNQVCVTQGQCFSGSAIATQGYEAVTCYYSPDQAVIGECCDPPTEPPPPPPPAHLETCPGNQVCVSQGQCFSGSAVATETYEAVTCYHDPDQSVIGECCDPPTEPPTPAPVYTCPGTQDCVATYQCNSDGTINTDGAGLINTRFYLKPCYIDAANEVTGVCCQPPTPPPPPTPAPLVACPGTQICLSQGDCASQSAANGGNVDSYTTSCFVDEANYVTGVCCDSPIRVVDVCPGKSVCQPEILCVGEILNDADQYVPYGSGGTWTQCGLSGSLDTPGVCCLNPEPEPPVSTPSPYVAASQCGARNVGLDLRTQVKLAKNEAQFGEFPWQAIIFFSNFTFKCGASLIEDRWLITAAHCVHGYQYSDFRIRLGEWQVDRYDEPLKYQDVDIASITIHPDFKPGPVHNDVAVIELTAPVTLQYHINRVCLPEVNQIPPQGTRCFASGWGKDAFNGQYQAILKKVDVPVVEKSYCQELLRKTRLGKYFILDDSFMCAGGEENIDACEGDGGGPLVCEDPETGNYYLAGITAWGIDCGQKDIPGVYADVQLFRPWINSIVYGPDEQQQQTGGYGRK